MNARISAPMLTTAEARAHVTIIEALQIRLAKRLSWRQTHAICYSPLEAFAPRCHLCRHKLTVTPWVDEVRAWRCNWCATGWKEAM